MDVEKKIRAKNVLGITSARYGAIPLQIDNLLISDDNCDEIIDITAVDIDDVEKLYWEVLQKSQNTPGTDPEAFDNDVLIYVCGYASFKIQAKILCKFCIEQLVGENFESEYIKNFDRGGLTVPSGSVLNVGKVCYATMEMLVSKNCESFFLSQKNHFQFLIAIVLKRIEEDEELHSEVFTETCVCNRQLKNIFMMVIKTICNILLSNYKKAKNNKIAEKKSSNSSKRKLQTLQ